ncbi:MAG: DUF2098 domain-containing protein [Euryarchaeota archaeon]|jgi:hypothetical protein|nr:DUF2098 domain-containing protein [Methanosarcinales archaeon]MEA3293361.1 DUF2098 domain-containing protein [Euryarchaeota archaeon]
MPKIIECESGSYPVEDIYGRPLEVGSPVRYGGTGTSGFITEITCDSEGAWAQIDTTNLLYKLETLTFLDDFEAKEAIGERIFSTDEMEESLAKMEEEASKAMLHDENVESGG